MVATVPGYNMIRRLGVGGFGEVYLATRLRDTRSVAIKLLQAPTVEHLHRLAREGLILQQHLAHPNIVDLLDMCFDAGPAYIVMEYCNGGSLRPWVDKLRPWTVVLRAGRDAAEGLAGVHAKGGFHRDIKPDNLLLVQQGQDWRVKLGDFGLAREPALAVNSAMTRSPFGTPGYMAPELLRGGDCDARSDIFSLGVTLLELLTGSRALSATAQLPSQPPRLKALVVSMLDLSAAKRPTAVEVSATLGTILLEANQPQKETRSAAAQLTKAKQAGGGGGIWAALAVLALGGALAANANKKDRSGQWRDNSGKFRGGPFF